MAKFKAALIGVNGYTGMELARILANHPYISLHTACSRSEAGKTLGKLYPFLLRLAGSEIVISQFDANEIAKNCQIAFLAVPAGTAMTMAAELLAKGVKVVDLSADFRLRNPAAYEHWYRLPHNQQDLLKKAVYGLPEIYAEKIAKAELVANPGCYPTASILGLAPALAEGLIETDSIIIDAKSGASGAGRKAVLRNLFCEVSDNFRAYGIPGHRHTPEIEQELTLISNKKIRLTFTPHLVPMKRGILATIYTRPKNENTSLEELHRKFTDFWANSCWMRVLPQNSLPETINVRGSMYCDIGLVVDDRARQLIILSAIDNLCRGASGQAVVNANLMLGLAMDDGFAQLAPLP